MARKRSSLNGGELKAFRHAVSVLRSKGLVSKRVDARKQKPTRYMKNKVKNLAPILTGEAAGVKVRPDLLRQYREAGFNIVNRRVIVEKRPDEIARVRKGHALIRRRLGPGFTEERLLLPYGPKNIDDLRERFRAHPDTFDHLKEKGDLFAFRIFGYNSVETFETFEKVVAELEKYSALQDDRYEEEVWEGLEFYRVFYDPDNPFKSYWPKNEKRTLTRTAQDRRSASRATYSRTKGERIHKLEDAERKRIKRATDLSWAEKEREKDRLRKASTRAANPDAEKAARLREFKRRRDRRLQAKADERNGT